MYRVLEVAGDPSADEPMGTKRKFWCVNPLGEQALFKYVRVNNGIPTGEDWSERIVCELAKSIGIPAAEVELATYNGNRGVVSKDFTRLIREGSDPMHLDLYHGNELLVQLFNPIYPEEAGFRTSAHTLDLIATALDVLGATAPLVGANGMVVTNGMGVFSGYLMLDALVGNTDRHHENWGLLFNATAQDRKLSLSPSYDHASSLGRELRETRMKALLSSDRGVAVYADRAKSAIYAERDAGSALSPSEAFRLFSMAWAREAGAEWLGKLAGLSDSSIQQIVSDVPNEIMPDAAKDFACKLMIYNKTNLLSNGI